MKLNFKILMKHIKQYEKYEKSNFKVGDKVRFNKNCSGDEESRKIIFTISKIEKNNNAILLYPNGSWKSVDLNYVKNCLDKVTELEINTNKYNI